MFADGRVLDDGDNYSFLYVPPIFSMCTEIKIFEYIEQNTVAAKLDVNLNCRFLKYGAVLNSSCKRCCYLCVCVLWMLFLNKSLSRTVQWLTAAVVFNFVAVSVEYKRNGGLHHQESDELQDTRNLRDEDLRNLAQVYICFIFIYYVFKWNFINIFIHEHICFFRKLHNADWQMLVLCHIFHVWAPSTSLCWTAKRNEVITISGKSHKGILQASLSLKFFWIESRKYILIDFSVLKLKNFQVNACALGRLCNPS